ncbi:MAG: hypothetical protein ACRDJ3_02870, partial [Solirubrobacteraceae bacterium]
MTRSKPHEKLNTERRRLIARECAGRARTLAEIARSTAIANGALVGLLERMVREGVLQAAGPPGARGTLYTLAPEWESVLAEPISVGRIGELESGHRLLRVTGASSAIAGVIAGTNLTDETLWSIHLTGDEGWLLAFGPVTPTLTVDRLVAAFEKAGASCSRFSVDAAMSGDDLHRYAAAVLDAADVIPRSSSS